MRNLIGGDRGTENQQVELDRIRISDYKVERILSFRDMTPPGWAGWISLDADDSPILMRDRSTQEIYRLDLQFR